MNSTPMIPILRSLTWVLAAAVFAASSDRAVADDSPKAPSLTDAQKARLMERDRLGKQAQKLRAEGKLPEVIAAAEAMLQIEREVLGEASEDAIGSLEMLAGLHEAGDDWPATTAARARILALISGEMGEKHWRTIDARFAMVRAEVVCRLDRDGRLRFIEVKQLVSKMRDLYGKGRYSEANIPARQALELNREVLGEQHPDTIASLNNLAQMLKARGDLEGARPMLERALRLNEQVLGERHPLTMTSLNNLALLLLARGDLEAAQPMLERALRLREDVLGERHPDTIAGLDNLGMLLQARGDLEGARPMLERALRLYEQVLGERHPDTIISLDLQARLLEARGDLEGARPMLERALRLREEVLGERHPETIASLNNLGMLLQARGDLDTPLPMLERALRLREEVLGERHPFIANSLNNLALLLLDRGDLEGARPMLERALRLNEQVLGERHPNTIAGLNNLASLLEARGDLEAARPMLERALRLNEQVLGRRHPHTISALKNLARLLRDQGKLDEAREVAARSLASSQDRLAASLPTLTGREQLALLKVARSSLDLSLGLSALRPEDPAVAYAGLLNFKGVVAEADAARRLGDRLEARDLRGRLATSRTRLNALAYARVPAAMVDGHALSIRALADEVAALELALVRAVDWRPRRPEVANVAASLPEGACLVDFFRYWYVPAREPGKTGPPAHDRYVAFVVLPGAAPARVDLGPATAVDEALASWRGRLQRGAVAEDLGQAVARLAWEPLVPHLGNTKTVLISPDGDLAFLPWAALPDGDSGSCLLRRFTFGVVPSARQLVALAEREPKPANGGLLAVGGVDYGRGDPGEVVAVASRSAAVGRSALAFGALPGTDAEARAVAALHQATHPDSPAAEAPTGAGATKGRLAAAMPGRRFLHLATHGYFAPPEFRNALAPEDERTSLKAGEGMGRAEVTGFYPGLLSGLVWAGASSPAIKPSTGALDVGAGLMTAEEVGGLDLEGCELAVLSACETGLGRSAGGEGVLGLQRAFQQAGARTVVASLWKVDDDATRELMTRFYKNLWEKKLPPSEALRQSQLSILDDPDFGDGGNPRLWAAWTLSGDPGGLRKPDHPAAPGSGVKK